MEPGESGDDSLTLATYERTAEQAEALGLSAGAEGGATPAEERSGGGAALAGSLEQVGESLG